MKKMTFFTLAIVIILSTALFSQSPMSVDLRLGMGLPQGEFKDNVQNNGFDFTGDFLYRFANSPLSVGASASFIIYGSETRREPFSTTIPDVFVDVTTTNSIIMGNFLIRIQGNDGQIVPYGEGIFGLSYLTTDTRIENASNSEEIASSNNFNDITFCYGGGAGLKIRVYKNSNYGKSYDGDNDLSSVYVNLNFRYIKGGEAEYLKEGSISFDGTKVVYDTKRSTTDINIITIGVTLGF
ncbi:hypothetical protein DRQ07_05615 [candidate division KSB1 bacterium]|nr:MAG: hypothetical protein DRQ07_05615 [candidate division KSB1 bacterium]